LPSPDVTRAALVPVFHSTGEWAWIAGIVPGILGPWRFGAAIAVFARKGGYDPEQTLHVLQKHKVKDLFATPTALRAMAALGDVSDRYPGISLRHACAAGEPLNPERLVSGTGQDPPFPRNQHAGYPDNRVPSRGHLSRNQRRERGDDGEGQELRSQ
jgi:hypothetical protein